MSDNFSQKQIRETWDYWYPLVYGYFYKRLNNQQDVEELTSNTITSLLLNSEVENPKGYVWQTAKNQLYKYIENKTKSPQIVELDSTDTDNSFFYAKDFESFNDQEMEYSDHYKAKIKQLIDCCKENLSFGDFEIVCYSILDEKNSTEVGQKFAINPATVRQKLKRSFAKLHQNCTQHWIELKTAKAYVTSNS